MTDKIIDIQTNLTPVPSTGQEGYLMPYVKPQDNLPPAGGNFTLKDLYEPVRANEHKNNEQDMEIGKKVNIADYNEHNILVDEQFTQQDAKKADKSDFQRLLMTADTPVFQTDSNGFPVPFQKARVHVDKGTLKDDVTYEGKAVPTNTLDFDVEPSDMAEEGIVLKNIMNTNTDTWVNKGYYQPFDSVSLTSGHKYYTRLTTIAAAPTANASLYTILEISRADNDSIIYINIKGKVSDEEQTGSGVFNMKETNKGKMFAWAYPAIPLKVKEAVVIDITELSARYPQYTDEQLKAILDASLPYISAGQSKTLGGVITLENLVPNPFSTDGWEAGTEVENFSIRDGIITGKPTNDMYSSSQSWIKKDISKKLPPKTQVFLKIGGIVSTGGFNVGVNYTLGENSNNFAYFPLRGYSQSVVVGVHDTSAPTITITPSKGVILIKTKDSLLDLLLTLNGIAEDKKAEWCNEHIPFFEGTYDLVLGMKDSLTVTATAGAHTSSVTFKKAISKIDVKSIVESGEGYQKFADGTLIQWGSVTSDTKGKWNSWLSGLYYATIAENENFPLPFKNTPSVIGSVQGVAMIASVQSEQTRITKMVVTRPDNTAPSMQVSYIAIGRWK